MPPKAAHENAPAGSRNRGMHLFVVARQRQAHIYANICAMPKRHQFAGSLHKSLGAPETKEERQNVWEEVCRRAKATVEECKRIGCPLREGVEP